MAKKAKKAARSASKKVNRPAGKAGKKAKPAAKKKAKVAKSKKKPAAKKAKKKIVKKVVAKKIAKKAVKKVVSKTKVKEVPRATPPPVIKPLSAKPVILSKAAMRAKKAESYGLDDDGNKKGLKKNTEYEPVFEYKPQARPKPLGSQPKPFIGKDSRTKYSDDELKEFREIILKKLEEAKRDYELLKSTLSHKDDHGTDDTSPTFKLLEDGSDVMTREETAQLAARQEKFIQALQNALIRIENKTYGICRVSGKLIPKERLRSVPHATLSIDAKLEQY